APSKLALILDLTMKSLEAVIYFASYLVIDVDKDAKAKAIESLETQLKEKTEANKKALEEVISGGEVELAKQVKELQQKLKDHEKGEIAASDLQLKHRQEVAK